MFLPKLFLIDIQIQRQEIFLEETFWSTKLNKEKGKVIVAIRRRAKLITPPGAAACVIFT